MTIGINTIKGDILKMLNEILKPNETYGIYFINNDLRKPFIDICQRSFNYSIKLVISNLYCRDVINEENQRDIVGQYHDQTHTGITETYNQLKKNYYWPHMKSTITEIVNSCEICLRSKYERHPYCLKFSGPLLAKNHLKQFT